MNGSKLPPRVAAFFDEWRCRRWQKKLTRILTYGSLTPLEQDLLREHLAECAVCSSLDSQRAERLSALRVKAGFPAGRKDTNR